MRVYLFHRREVTRGGLLLGLFIFTFILAVQARGIERRFFGVKSGVTLEGRVVEGLLPAELTRLVRQLSVSHQREPRNAMFFVETGEVIPERAGMAVDVAGTVKMVSGAAPQSRLSLLTKPVPAPITTEYFKPVFRGPADRPQAALAINVAWGEEFMPRMLACLKEQGVKASFFFVGDWVRQFPEIVKSVAAGGHEIGNHGLTHTSPRSLSRQELSRLILENEALLTKVLGKQPPALFAPPSGEFDTRTVGVAAELGFRTILWTIDTIDWQRPSPDLIVQRVRAKICNGAIILMHPTAPTVEALPVIIRLLREKGLRLVTVGRLLEGSQVKPSANEGQISGSS